MSTAEQLPTLISELRDVLVGPLPEIGRRFSVLLADLVPHTALVIFTRECTGRPRKVAGDPAIVDRVTIAELDRIRTDLAVGQIFRGQLTVAGREREVVAVLDRTDTVLVLMPRSTTIRATALELTAALFGVVATGIQLQVRNASPAYLAESRAASSERARTVAEMTEVHAATLETILATLRSDDLDDTRARTSARETTSSALIGLRSAVDVHRELAEEAITTAFARMRGELRSLLKHRNVELELVEPPVEGRGLPGEVAHGARAVVRGAVLALADQHTLSRIRVAWSLDGSALLIDIRDDGRGEADVADLERQLRSRVETLGGTIESESTTGWGSRISATIPLDAASATPADHTLSDLAPREIEVLEHLVAGRRNKAISERLGVSESTVKFHVAGVLKKLGVDSRGAAAAAGTEAGVKPAP
ncbi:helix-turn-helix transcriptional regulator [Rhodococcus sp. KBS0724]|uniref:LuxR C-terminal-related transcriptional regulator n=1 Tax=Rhodococcus sp. KBS0724 TaxID=1179674 RepID=UPI00110DD76E|nr:LuxR C-terminal-related transcriptional regulator [Rhodococcus sp. KBS0724]TSD49713.1 helix-turn-helix transcriptional regulator [Rhodococcus sp. KBS0724]